MIQAQTLVKITDNSGAKIGRVIRVIGGTGRRYARIGDEVVLSVRIVEPNKNVKKKEVARAVVVRQRQPYRRKEGSYIRFDENAVVLIDKERKEPRATRIFGPVPRELGEGYRKIVSLAPEIV